MGLHDDRIGDVRYTFLINQLTPEAQTEFYAFLDDYHNIISEEVKADIEYHDAELLPREEISAEELAELERILDEAETKADDAREQFLLKMGEYERAYLARVKGDKAKILSDANELLKNATKSDFSHFFDTYLRLLKAQKARIVAEQKKLGIKPKDISGEHIFRFKDFDGCLFYIWNFILPTHRAALQQSGLSFDELLKMAAHKAADLYPTITRAVHVRFDAAGNFTGQLEIRFPIKAEAQDHDFPDRKTIAAADYVGLGKEQERELQAYNDKATLEQISLFGPAIYVPLFNGEPTNDLISADLRGVRPDAISKEARIELAHHGKHIITIQDFNSKIDAMAPSTMKLLDAATANLTSINQYRGNPLDVKTVVTLDLREYARANGYDIDAHECSSIEEARKDEARIKDNLRQIKDTVKADLSFLSKIRQTWTEESGPNKGDFASVILIGDYSVRQGKIRIQFGDFIAKYLARNYIMQLPTVLLKHDNRNPNAYPIGRKLAFHHCNDNNRTAGTDTRLSVLKLLEAAPQIQSYEDMIASGNRNWKKRIKERLEKALDANVEIGYLKAWNYASRDKLKITKTDASAMSWEEYSSLYVDFAVADDLPDNDRLYRKTEQKRLAAEATGKPKRSRGRPPKKPASEQ